MPVLTALVSSAALVLLGLEAPAADAAPSPADAPAHHRVATEPLCGAPQPGTFACQAVRRTDVKPVRGLVAGAGTPEGFGASDLRDAYRLPADGGAGQTVAIVDAYDDPTAEADLAVYRAQYGLPACTADNGCFTKVDQRGGTHFPQPDYDWAGEISLDLDMVSAAAPSAHLLLVEADSNGLADLAAAVDQAVAMGAKYVSNSYSTDEIPEETTALDASYNHPGVAVVASTGDYGYGVGYPAASQYVTAVGGTSLARDGGTARGWSESAWDGAGSGCSRYEPKPAFQSDSGCARRSLADVSAVADPETGVAIYQTYGSGGWGVAGGTSVSAPLIAGVYAAAGTPTPGSYPNSYPYLADGSGLNDAVGGSNGDCSPAYLCTGGEGYDGPTGLGTPDGTTAFRNRAHGEVSGTVTDAAKGTPLAGATVTAGRFTAHTDANGAYTLVLPAGGYDVKATAFGHEPATAAQLAVADGASVERDFALTAIATETVSGKVTDGSGHGWPLYAEITVDGVPGGPLWTDPVTGAYSVALPKNGDYTFHVTSAYPGYRPATASVALAQDAVTRNVSLTADAWDVTAPGYAARRTGPTEGFDSPSLPTGWSVENAEGTTGGWEFDDPGDRGNTTGGEGGFAVLDSDHYGSGTKQDSSLVSPDFDFTGQDGPEVSFRTDYRGSFGQDASVDVSSDGGHTWQTAWTAPPQPVDVPGPATIEVPLTEYAGRSAVRVRFHFAGNWTNWWKVDDVFVGDHGLRVLPGGLVAGIVTDANTGKGVSGVEVTDASGVGATTTATPDDPSLADGFYWYFAAAGEHRATASKYPYTSASKNVTVTGDTTAKAAFRLKAGQLAVTPGSLDASVGFGQSAVKTLTVTNTGGAAATLKLKEHPGDTTVAAQGAPLQRVKGADWHLSLRKAPASVRSAASARASKAAPAAGDAWQAAPDLPVPSQDNAVDTYRGTLYSGFGFNGTSDSNELYAYDPRSGAWTQKASAADTREAPAHGFVDGKLYVVGGWGALGVPDDKLEVYDPATDAWTTGTRAPAAYAGSSSAVLDGKLYVVGGCLTDSCGTDRASVYDPAADAWSQIADYPEPTAWSSCGGIDGRLYCAGGATDDGDIRSAYVYDPVADSWSALPDLPEALWGSAYTSANGRLLISGGMNEQEATNEGFAYDPEAGDWTKLPNAAQPSVRGGGAAGFYKVGGAVHSGAPLTTVEVLPGYDQMDGADVTWLTESTDEVTVEPGRSARITVTLDSSQIAQPGTYSAELAFSTDTPYVLDGVPVSLTVSPPKSWGKITGTVLGATASGTGAPLAGATVEVDSWTAQYTLATGKDGRYELWLDQRNNPLTVIVAKDGYKPTVATVKVVKGKVVTTDFTLKKA